MQPYEEGGNIPHCIHRPWVCSPMYTVDTKLPALRVPPHLRPLSLPCFCVP